MLAGAHLTRVANSSRLYQMKMYPWRTMNRTIYYTVTAIFLVPLLAIASLGAGLSVCDYEPPESRIADLGVQGSFSWYDGPFADDRNRSITANVVGDYTGMISSPVFGQALDARTEIRVDDNGWTANAFGSGSLRSFFDAQSSANLFGVGAIGFSLSTRSGVEVDLTGGIGTGRFRDVTPLAQAIGIQNELLDLGQLLAPVSSTTLLELAQILGGMDATDDEKVAQLVNRLVATELIPGEGLGVRGLLAIEEILEASDETRLCGLDVQARLGIAAVILPEFNLATTGMLLVRYAAVPDPVSQFDSSGEAKIRLAHPEQMNIQGELAYSRQLPDGWTARAQYRFAMDRMWTDSNSTAVSHAASGSLTTQIFGNVGLSLVGSAQFYTGDEEITLALSVYMETDLF